MATYYVSNSGNDANNGLGPDASHASNKPWLTIAKALGAAGISSGDTVVLGPGVYRETVTVGMTSATATTTVQGDPDNSSGFKDGSGNRLAAGLVRWTNFTTDDTTAAPASHTLTLNGRDFLAFQHIFFVTGNGQRTVNATTAVSTDITFEDCDFLQLGDGNAIQFTGSAGVANNLLIDRCRFFGHGNASTLVNVTAPNHSAEYDLNTTVRNSVVVGGGTGVSLALSAGSGPGYGMLVQNCTLYQQRNAALSVTGTPVPATEPAMTVQNSLIFGVTGISAQVSGQIVENYNLISCPTARGNTTAGANSVANTYALLIAVGQHLHQFGGVPRPFLSPLAGSPILGFGNDTGAPTTDIFERPRPAGGESTSAAAGAMERHDTARQETTTVDASGSGLVITGPGDHDIYFPVNAASTTISIKARYDTNHGAGSKPQVILQANDVLGVVTETKTMTVAVDTWEQLSFTAFTPSAKGVVTVRLVSRAAAGSGKAFFDTAAVS